MMHALLQLPWNRYLFSCFFLSEIWTRVTDLQLMWSLHLKHIYQKARGVEVPKMLSLPNQHEAHFLRSLLSVSRMMGSEITCFKPALSRRSQFRSLASLCLPYTKPPLGQFKAWAGKPWQQKKSWRKKDDEEERWKKQKKKATKPKQSIG